MNILPEGCQLNPCRGIAPDASDYSIQDAVLFNEGQIDVIVECNPKFVCPPGVYPKVVSFPPQRFVFPSVPQTPGEPIYLSMQGCQSWVNRTLPATATDAEIKAAADEIIREVAQQTAECQQFPNLRFGGTRPVGPTTTVNAQGQLVP